MELGLTGRRALVTGASRGVGFACAMALAAEGCDLALVARDVHRLKTAVKTIRARHRVGVSSHATDLADPVRQNALVDVVGDVDILVNIAGAIPPGHLLDLDDAAWRAAWDVKVFASISLSRLVLPRMQAQESGVIVNVIGGAASRPGPDSIVGASGNAALAAFTRALGAGSLRHGVRVVGVNPGVVLTDRLELALRRAADQRWGNADRWDELLPADPPPGTPEQVADVIAFLASDRAAYVSGTIVTVDGGASGS